MRAGFFRAATPQPLTNQGQGHAPAHGRVPPRGGEYDGQKRRHPAVQRAGLAVQSHSLRQKSGPDHQPLGGGEGPRPALLRTGPGRAQNPQRSGGADHQPAEGSIRKYSEGAESLQMPARSQLAVRSLLEESLRSGGPSKLCLGGDASVRDSRRGSSRALSRRPVVRTSG
jgi:hypothetical protein